MNDFSTVIIGGGISGLTCAKYLNEKVCSFMLLEGSDTLGGRVRTDKVDGFTLDRGSRSMGERRNSGITSKFSPRTKPSKVVRINNQLACCQRADPLHSCN